MRRFGLVLIALGFLAGSLVSVLDPDTIPWVWFAVSLAVAIAGVALVQDALKREASHGDKLDANIEELEDALKRITENARKLEQDKLTIDLYDVPAYIDKTFPEDVTTFVDIRDAINHTWGTQVYGAIMSHFAAAERYMNRVWSAAADGYIDEAHEYIGHARAQFEEALGRFEAARDAR